MPYLGHENLKETDNNQFISVKTTAVTFPIRRMFRMYYDNVSTGTVPATTLYLREMFTGQQAIYLPASSSGHINWTIYANVNGTLGTTTELGSYAVNSSSSITYTGGAIGSAINSMVITPTNNAAATGLELIVTGVTAGHTNSTYVFAEIMPHLGIEDVGMLKNPATATLTAIEGVI